MTDQGILSAADDKTMFSLCFRADSRKYHVVDANLKNCHHRGLPFIIEPDSIDRMYYAADSARIYFWAKYASGKGASYRGFLKMGTAENAKAFIEHLFNVTRCSQPDHELVFDIRAFKTSSNISNAFIVKGWMIFSDRWVQRWSRLLCTACNQEQGRIRQTVTDLEESSFSDHEFLNTHPSPIKVPDHNVPNGPEFQKRAAFSLSKCNNTQRYLCSGEVMSSEFGSR